MGNAGDDGEENLWFSVLVWNVIESGRRVTVGTTRNIDECFDGERKIEIIAIRLRVGHLIVCWDGGLWLYDWIDWNGSD